MNLANKLSRRPAKARLARIEAAAERNPAPLRYAISALKRAGLTSDRVCAADGIAVLGKAMTEARFDTNARWALKSALRAAGAIGGDLGLVSALNDRQLRLCVGNDGGGRCARSVTTPIVLFRQAMASFR